MQKLELRQNLKQIIEKTKSKKIIEFFNNSEKKDTNVQKNILLNLIIESKAGFDQSIIDKKQNKILEQFDAKKYYETKYFGTIVQFISISNFNNSNAFLQNSKQITEFFTHHNTLITSFDLIENLLFQDLDLKESVNIDSFIEAENNGYLSFEIFSENSINLKKYSVIVYNINELVKITTEVITTIEKLKFENAPKLILTDSGSNTLLSIKLPKEISKSISKIIDNAWQYFTNRTGHKLGKLNNNLSESLEILKKIKSAEKKEIVSPEQAEIWKRGILESTEAIILNNALTKSKSEEIFIISNQKMLEEATNKYLTDGKNK